MISPEDFRDEIEKADKDADRDTTATGQARFPWQAPKERPITPIRHHLPITTANGHAVGGHAETQSSLLVDEVSGKVVREEITEVPENFHWGYNRVTGMRINCSCNARTSKRSLHACTCPVWMNQSNVVYYPLGKEPQQAGHVVAFHQDSEYPCFWYKTTSCRHRSPDKTQWCRNCLNSIGDFTTWRDRRRERRKSGDSHLGGIRS